MLWPLLKEIVSENQNAFVPERMITDNAMIAFECFHFIEHGKNQYDNYCAYKLDLSKAYDRVDWEFLEGSMDKLAFSGKWINWMTCTRSVSFLVKFYGNRLGKFSPTRGLRQGDSLSLFFLLMLYLP